MSKPLTLSATLTEAAVAADARSGVLEVEFITPGWGSSGYYSREVVEAAAPLFAVGTHLYLDHPTETEEQERPVRSVRDIAAVITEAGTVNPDTGGIRGKVKATAPYRELLTDETLMENIGLSIRGSATDITVGEAEGRKGPIIEGLADIASVDFVTRAGRGGRVLSVLESARPEVVERAVARGISEATADERRTQLSDAVRTAYAGNDRYAWVQDFDDSTVWFQASAENERSRTWQQAYTVADDDMSVSLTGERVEVRPVTKYVPVNPAGLTTTEASKEDTMGNIQIDEAEHRSLVERAGRVDTLESERDTAVTERDTLRTENARLRARESAVTHARTRVTAANAGLPTATVERIVTQATATIPLTESGQLDTAALDTAVDTARTAEESYLAGLAEAAGIGSVTGFGAPSGAGGGSVSESEFDKIFDTKGA